MSSKTVVILNLGFGTPLLANAPKPSAIIKPSSLNETLPEMWLLSTPKPKRVSYQGEVLKAITDSPKTIDLVYNELGLSYMTVALYSGNFGWKTKSNGSANGSRVGNVLSIIMLDKLNKYRRVASTASSTVLQTKHGGPALRAVCHHFY